MLRIDRKPHSGGRVVTDQQELAVVEMVRARNDIRLSEIKQAIEENNDTFANVASISLPTVARLLKWHQVSMKHIYLVPFERNNDRVKQLRAEYVQSLELLKNHGVSAELISTEAPASVLHVLHSSSDSLVSEHRVSPVSVIPSESQGRF
ncbi:hypothetical protein DPX16_9589 [Anabarilius grahami]|uniref:Uncharacterized protein n=1 Tax=Anabarilius grahami TaxID=495550 RepID=A0A3N0Z5Z0_ANAGA|nr:hypothetical protein DPX16_9589 [Anabarilius grahami]